jgi:hypothetical protein
VLSDAEELAEINKDLRLAAVLVGVVEHEAMNSVYIADAARRSFG